MSVRALLSASHESALHHAVKSMPSSIARSRPVRAGERADELTGCGAQESVIGERNTQSLRAVGLESAPEGCGEASGAIVVDSGDQQVHGLQHSHVACDHGDRVGDECAHDGRGAGRYVGNDARSAVGCRLSLLPHLEAPFWRLLASSMTDFDRVFDHDLRAARPQAAPASLGDGRAAATVQSILLQRCYGICCVSRNNLTLG